MLISLRKSWLAGGMKEDSIEYQIGPATPESEGRFHHERLDVYQAGLAFVRWFTARPDGLKLSHRLARRIDQTATAMVLNIAEGNGRYSELDQTRFLAMAAVATVKASTYLDLWGQTTSTMILETTSGQQFLARIMAMLERMIGH